MILTGAKKAGFAEEKAAAEFCDTIGMKAVVNHYGSQSAEQLAFSHSIQRL